jgi:hypothetical protein
VNESAARVKLSDAIVAIAEKHQVYLPDLVKELVLEFTPDQFIIFSVIAN